MNIKDMLFGTVGGLGLFLFGMGYLSDGLKLAAGENLRRMLSKVTRWRVLALLIGAGVTCLVQSSSATTVMVVGLVNAGLLTLRQAICVVLGANIGTTFTAWLIAGMSVFKITSYALPAVGIGFLLHVLGKRRKTRHLGQILLGFGILFIGISFMKGAFDPLKDSDSVRNLLISIGDRPILAVLAGAAFTMLIQSSSASIAMIQMLAFSGAFGVDYDVALRVAIPFVLGDNIGTTITAQLAALRTNLSGRRTAMAHTMFNVLGVAIILPIVYTGWYVQIVRSIAPVALTQKTIMLYIAIAHSAFNITSSLVILPAVGLLEMAVVRLLPARTKDLEIQPVTLERHLLDTPPMAIAQARKEILRMAETARKALNDAVTAFHDVDRRRLTKVAAEESAVDDFQTEITGYLVELSQRSLSPEMANELPVLLHTVNDLERVADHAVNIAETASRKIEQKQTFSDSATSDSARLRTEVSQMFQDVLAAVAKSDVDLAHQALEHEKTINQMQVDFRNSHIRRLSEGRCSAMAGLLFIDFVDNMEKIGDHLANVAQGVIGGLQWAAEHNSNETAAETD
ncbi:MAG: Na/Pi cotransporter family protein [Planctomycetota bacterium]|nr:Na/Pi cotransporter family protein [Planctomycetota bacterium]